MTLLVTGGTDFAMSVAARSMWGECDLARIERDTTWRPAPPRQPFQGQLDLIATHET